MKEEEVDHSSGNIENENDDDNIINIINYNDDNCDNIDSINDDRGDLSFNNITDNKIITDDEKECLYLECYDDIDTNNNANDTNKVNSGLNNLNNYNDDDEFNDIDLIENKFLDDNIEKRSKSTDCALNTKNIINKKENESNLTWENWLARKTKILREKQRLKNLEEQRIKNCEREKELDKQNKKKLFEEIFPKKCKVWSENLKKSKQKRKIDESKKNVVPKKTETEISENFKKWLKQKAEEEKLKKEKIKKENLQIAESKKKSHSFKYKYDLWYRKYIDDVTYDGSKNNQNNNTNNNDDDDRNNDNNKSNYNDGGDIKHVDGYKNVKNKIKGENKVKVSENYEKSKKKIKNCTTTRSYMGCFLSVVHHRATYIKSQNDCSVFCTSESNTNFMALSRGKECYCIDRATDQVSTNVCDLKCPNGIDSCGGVAVRWVERQEGESHLATFFDVFGGSNWYAFNRKKPPCQRIQLHSSCLSKHSSQLNNLLCSVPYLTSSGKKTFSPKTSLPKMMSSSSSGHDATRRHTTPHDATRYHTIPHDAIRHTEFTHQTNQHHTFLRPKTSHKIHTPHSHIFGTISHTSRRTLQIAMELPEAVADNWRVGMCK
ncbi:hypothetical protein HELRODRAFT_177887 [Helobdella robusta]|uniref:WSC domain-containing protein n=1 Tax=Helobdella robusta TaxID=6412 RepID=T1FCF3_HELRO|nr:hypothetical protein HELRODRAFT_177887 [Helobdella robusta]ESN97466.1 hypothetical protein HELRODRAFT_177887 [Helobdella robusta]